MTYGPRSHGSSSYLSHRRQRPHARLLWDRLIGCEPTGKERLLPQNRCRSSHQPIQNPIDLSEREAPPGKTPALCVLKSACSFCQGHAEFAPLRHSPPTHTPGLSDHLGGSRTLAFSAAVKKADRTGTSLSQPRSQLASYFSFRWTSPLRPYLYLCRGAH
jgi:hypothetical protein